MTARFPFSDLEPWFRGSSETEIAAKVGVTRRAVYDWRRRGLTAERADAVACALGEHPALVWGPRWYAADADRAVAS